MTKNEFNEIIEKAFDRVLDTNYDCMGDTYDYAINIGKKVHEEIGAKKGEVGPYLVSIYAKAIEMGAHIGMHAALVALKDAGIIQFDEE